MIKNKNFVIGVDFGTDSVRAILVDASNGQLQSSSTFEYPRWKKKLYCDSSKNIFRQHPLDYIEGLIHTVTSCINMVEPIVSLNIKGISIATTGSTPAMVNKEGVPLALTPGFENDPDAMFMLWKDHSAIKEAEEINKNAKHFAFDYLKNSGGIYSSEWYWSKLLYIIKNNNKVTRASFSFVEHCDWLPFLLTGGMDANEIQRGVCASVHKALWSEDLGGYPPVEFFTALDTRLSSFRKCLPEKVLTADAMAGIISKEWSEKLGLPKSSKVAIGLLDAHAGAIGGEIKPYYLSKVIGTSTCDMVVIPKEEFNEKVIKGICGQVDGSILPDMIGLEAGQSSFGDSFSWYRELLEWGINNFPIPENEIERKLLEKIKVKLHEDLLTDLALASEKLELDENAEIATDWLNGRRTPDANPALKSSLTGLNLSSNAPRIFRALVEAHCFGAKRIVERFEVEGVPIKGIIALGGIANKSPYIMQMMSDILGRPILIHSSTQTCAIGTAMLAAKVAGVYSSVSIAVEKMGQGYSKEYQPDHSRSEYYAKRYLKYISLGNKTQNVLNE